MKSKAYIIKFCFSTLLLACGNASAQSLRGIQRINETNLRLPPLTITGVSFMTTEDQGLVEITTTLQRQRVEIPTSSSTTSVIDTYTGTAVREVTLFDPRTYNDLNPNTTINTEGPANRNPNNCGALARDSSETPATYSYPVVPGTLPAQNPLGGDYWLGQGADTGSQNTSVAVGAGLGIASYVCPLLP
jgi:hypothetical protein